MIHVEHIPIQKAWIAALALVKALKSDGAYIDERKALWLALRLDHYHIDQVLESKLPAYLLNFVDALRALDGGNEGVAVELLREGCYGTIKAHNGDHNFDDHGNPIGEYNLLYADSVFAEPSKRKLKETKSADERADSGGGRPEEGVGSDS